MSRVIEIDTTYQGQEARLLRGAKEPVKGRLHTLLAQGWRIVPESTTHEGNETTMGVYRKGEYVYEEDRAV